MTQGLQKEAAFGGAERLAARTTALVANGMAKPA